MDRFPTSFSSRFSNRIVSYLPTPGIGSEGGMEAKLAYKAYLLPAELPGDWEPQIRERVEEMFAQLSS